MFETENNETANDDVTASGHELTETVAAIVAAFASRETATVDEIVELAHRLSASGSALTAARTTQTTRRHAGPVRKSAGNPPAPAVSLDNAITEDSVYCLCCGRGFTMLKRHLKAEHNLTEEQYRTKFDLPEDFLLVAPSYSARKAAYAKQVGLGKYSRELPSIPAN